MINTHMKQPEHPNFEDDPIASLRYKINGLIVTKTKREMMLLDLVAIEENQEKLIRTCTDLNDKINRITQKVKSYDPSKRRSLINSSPVISPPTDDLRCVSVDGKKHHQEEANGGQGSTKNGCSGVGVGEERSFGMAFPKRLQQVTSEGIDYGIETPANSPCSSALLAAHE